MMDASAKETTRRYLIASLITFAGVMLAIIDFCVAISAGKNIGPWIILWGGLVFAALLAVYLVYQIRRTTGIKLLVEKRTDKLRKASEGLAHEIAERARAEDALKEQVQFLQTLIDAIPAPIFYKDAEGRYLGCNEAFTTCYGQTREEVIGKTVYDMAPRDLAEIYDTTDKALLKSAGIQKYEYSVMYADGIRREVFFTQTTFRDLGGEVAGLVGVMIDISERKRAEREIRKLNAELASKMEQLMAAQEELVSSEKLATIGLLAGSVGNELRNPLGVMNNSVYYLNIVLSEAGAEVKEYLDIIEHEIKVSRGIITEFLDAVRIMKPRAAKITVDELMARALGNCAIPANVSVKVDFPEMPSSIRVDPAQMDRVLQNLVANAVQAMPRGGTLSIAAQPVQGSRLKLQGPEEENAERGTLNVERDTDYVEIRITDTGEGISPENIGKLFQPLFTTRARGIGMGLTVCKNLTEANGGRIRIKSEPGTGTTVTLVLPA